MSLTKVMLFSGNSNPVLAAEIANHLNLPLSNMRVGKFSDGEVRVEVTENVRNRDVFIIQSLCAPTNDHLMELLVIADALYRASAAHVTAIVPYMGYARQDRRTHLSRTPITAKVVANMFSAVKIGKVLTVDLHAEQIQGFFDMPVDNVYGAPLLLDDVRKREYSDLIVVSPDVGGVVRARALAKRLDVNLAIIDKRRPNPNESEIMNIIGDVDGKTCLIIDDMVDTAGTLCNAAAALKKFGADTVVSYATHPVLSGNAIENIKSSALDELVITDTIPMSAEVRSCDRIRQLSVAPMLAECVRRASGGESLSSMFNGD